MDLQSIKKDFFVFRNGIVADTLRKAGMPHKVIFGLQIPQIAAIAKDLTPSSELAEALWNDSEVRESRILATYLFPVDEMSLERQPGFLAPSEPRKRATCSHSVCSSDSLSPVKS